MKRLTFSSVFFLLICFFVNSNPLIAECLDCHGEKDFVRETESGEEQSLYVNDSLFQASVHAGLECSDCHTDATGDEHAEQLSEVNCATCHDSEDKNYYKGIHGRQKAKGNKCAPSCVDCHGRHNILSHDNPESPTHSTNLPKDCSKCHLTVTGCMHDINLHEPVQKFERGVHGNALIEGNDEAASCNDCHGSHLLLPKSDPRSPIFRMNISQTCGKCHEDITDEYNSSSHAVALEHGEFDAPTCISCHGEHEILSPTDETSPTAPEHIARQTCAPCHGLLKLNEKYGLLPDPTDTYFSSYHGLASARGSKVAANCTSCHGIHAILSANDPNSSIHPDNLKKTCGACHPNASEAFTKSYVHATTTSLEDRISDVVKQVYIILIIVVIGAMFLHNLAIWFGYVRKKMAALRAAETIQRFDKHWVAQHILTFISFTILVITGFALKFPEATWVQVLTKYGLSESLRSIIHRVAAAVLIFAAVYQWLFLLFVKRWKGELKSLWPRFMDIGQFVGYMKYHLGLSKQKPEFERYSYIEKAEFWALVWGNLIMLFTGLILWFPTVATQYFPSWIVKVSETVHYYEAILASLAILFYHMFFAIFHPEDYPINLTGLTGKITKEEAKERFSRWFKKIESEPEHQREQESWQTFSEQNKFSGD